MIQAGLIDIQEIALRPSDQRTREACEKLACFLSYKMEFFRSEGVFEKEYLISVAEKIEARQFSQNEVLMKKGEIGDKMFVSIRGTLGIYFNEHFQTDEPPNVLVKEYKVVGERSLEMKGETRNASVVAMDKKGALCLSLDRDNYQKLINSKNRIDREKRYKFLVTFVSDLFKEYNPTKIRDINDNFCHQK